MLLRGNALALAHDQAATALATQRLQLGQEQAALVDARLTLAAQTAASRQRENLVRESLALAQRQLDDQTRQLHELQTALQKRQHIQEADHATQLRVAALIDALSSQLGAEKIPKKWNVRLTC